MSRKLRLRWWSPILGLLAIYGAIYGTAWLLARVTR